MPEPKSVPSLDDPKNQSADDQNYQQEKTHHHGNKEMPTSLPNQKVSSDGKKLPLNDDQK